MWGQTITQCSSQNRSHILVQLLIVLLQGKTNASSTSILTFLHQQRLASTDFSDHFSLISIEIKECSKGPLGIVGYLFPLAYCVAVSARGTSHTSWKITATNLSQTKWKIVSTLINLCFTILRKLLSQYATWQSASSDTTLHVKRRTTGNAAQSATGTTKSVEVFLSR